MDQRVGYEATTVENQNAVLVAMLVANLERDRQVAEPAPPVQEPPLGDILRGLVQQVEQAMQ